MATTKPGRHRGGTVIDASDLFNGKMAISGDITSAGRPGHRRNRKQAQISDSDLLGHLIFKEIYDHYCPVALLGEMWLGSGLPKDYLPRNTPSLEDAFAKATAAFERSGRDTIDIVIRQPRQVVNSVGKSVVVQGLYKARTWVSHVTNNRNAIIKHVVAEIIDEGSGELVHSTVATLTWNKKSKAALIEYVDEDVKQELVLGDLEERFREQFHIYTSHFDANTVRNMVRNLLADIDALPVPGGRGAVFVHKERDRVVKQLRWFFDRFNQEETIIRTAQICYNTSRVVNTQEEQKLVTDAVVAQTVKDIEDALKKIDKAAEEGSELPLSVRSVPDAIRQRLERYRIILGSSVEVAKQHLKLLEERIAEQEQS